MNLRLQDEQGRLVNMLDSDGHGGQVRWRGSMGVENFELGVSCCCYQWARLVLAGIDV